MEINLASGDSLEIDVDFQDADRTPLDLTGFTATYAARNDSGGSITMPAVVSDAINGTVKVLVPPNKLVGEGLWRHQVRIVGPSRAHTEDLGRLAIGPSLIS